MNQIHASAVIEGRVEMGSNNIIGPGAVLLGPVRIGSENYIGPGVSIGGISRERLEPSHRLAEPLPADRSYVVIGDNSMIFDRAVIHKPMFEETRIGDGVEIGAHVMVGHDCVLRDHAVLAPHVALGAYVTVGWRATLGLGSAVHNRLAIGALAMCGLSSAVVAHVPPGSLVYGNPARIHGPNGVGLARYGLESDEIAALLGALRGNGSAPRPWLRRHAEDYLADRTRWPNNKGEAKWHRQES